MAARGDWLPFDVSEIKIKKKFFVDCKLWKRKKIIAT